MSFKKGDTVYVKIGASKIMKGKTTHEIGLESFEGKCHIAYMVYEDGSVFFEYNNGSLRWFLPQCCEHPFMAQMLEIEAIL